MVVASSSRPSELSYSLKALKKFNNGEKQREAPDVLTGFVCLDPQRQALERAKPIRDPWTEDPSLDEGKPLYNTE